MTRFLERKETGIGLIHPNIVKKREMIQKKIVRIKFVIIIVKITIRVKDVNPDIFNQGIMSSAKNQFKDVVKYQMMLWWDVTSKYVMEIY